VVTPQVPDVRRSALTIELQYILNVTYVAAIKKNNNNNNKKENF